MSTGSFSAYCALTFKHAVEFSSFGCAPRFGFRRSLGQLDLLYSAAFVGVKPASVAFPHPRLTSDLGGLGLERTPYPC